MNSEVTDLAGIKAVTISTLQAKPSEGAFADGDKTKLDGIEAGADVTDTANVTAAGALMDSEVTDLAGIKAVTISTLQVKPSEGAFADGDKTKLDGIEAGADVTDTANVTAAGALMDSEVTDLAGIKAVTISTLQAKPSEGAFADGDKTKLDGIEAGADVTDTANVTAAGALMDSEVTDLAGIKSVTISTLQAKPSEGAFADGDKTKLDGIEAGADVTDTANVTAAGALMDSEVTDLAGIKSVTISTLQAKPSEGAFADGDKTKLDGIEAGADVTDTANVTAAGALMDSEVTDLAGIKSVTISTLQAKPSEGAFADGDKTKLDGIEAGADVTDTANVTAAGALMDSEVTDLAGIKSVTISTLQAKPSEGAFADGDKTKLDGIEAGADVTDTANVTNAGAVMNTGNQTISGNKTFLGTTTFSSSGFKLGNTLLTVSGTEINYLDGVVSNIQNQINALKYSTNKRMYVNDTSSQTSEYNVTINSNTLSYKFTPNLFSNTNKISYSNINGENITFRGKKIDSNSDAIKIYVDFAGCTINDSPNLSGIIDETGSNTVDSSNSSDIKLTADTSTDYGIHPYLSTGSADVSSVIALNNLKGTRISGSFTLANGTTLTARSSQLSGKYVSTESGGTTSTLNITLDSNNSDLQYCKPKTLVINSSSDEYSIEKLPLVSSGTAITLAIGTNSTVIPLAQLVQSSNVPVTITGSGTIKITETTIAASDLISLNNKCNSGGNTVIVNASSITTLTGSAANCNTLYTANSNGTITGLGNEAITLNDTTLSISVLNTLDTNTSGNIDASNITTLTGSATSCNIAYNSNGISGLGDEAVTLDDTSLAVSVLNTLDGNTSGTVNASTVNTLIGAAADCNTAYASNGISGLEDEDVTLDDTSLAVSVLNILDGNTTGTVNASVNILTGVAADCNTAYNSNGISGLGDEAVTLDDTSLAVSVLNILDGNTTGTVNATTITTLTGAAADCNTAYDSDGISGLGNEAITLSDTSLAVSVLNILDGNTQQELLTQLLLLL